MGALSRQIESLEIDERQLRDLYREELQLSLRQALKYPIHPLDIRQDKSQIFVTDWKAAENILGRRDYLSIRHMTADEKCTDLGVAFPFVREVYVLAPAAAPVKDIVKSVFASRVYHVCDAQETSAEQLLERILRSDARERTIRLSPD
ncbi:MAG TPA: hypothetical protein VLJ21_00145 [Candidatus Binatia bacterium]|nr:hypothetical protein [Candidatus Binatia bacterium]